MGIAVPSSCAKRIAAASVSVARVMETYMDDVKSALGENSKESFSSTVTTETSFANDSNIKALDVYKVLPAMILPAQVQKSNHY